MKERIMALVQKEKKIMKICMVYTFIWGLFAHAYMFLNNAISHDSLNEFNTDVFGNILRIERGRVLVPLYRIITRSVLTLPWLIGLISLIYIALAVFFVIKIFKIKSKAFIFILAGIMTANITVTATAASFIHDLDCNMLALLLSVVAVYLWHRYKLGFAGGAVLVGFSLALYQSYIAVTITLGIMVLVMKLLSGEKWKEVLVKGLYGITMLIGGGVVYMITIKIVTYITGVALVSGGYNSIDIALGLSIIDMIKLAFEAYVGSLKLIVHSVSIYPSTLTQGIHIIMAFISGAVLLVALLTKKLRIQEKLLLVILVGVLPFGLDIAYILTNGMSHDLMHYAFWLMYLYLLLLVDWLVKENKKGEWIRGVAFALVLVLLWGNVQTANAIYLKKDQQQDATLSLFTKVMTRVECTEDYIPGQTPVVFVGKPDAYIHRIPGFEFTTNLRGGIYITTLGSATRSFYSAYFRYVLLTPINLADQGVWNQIEADERTKEMPTYPQEGSIQMLDGVLVIKFN